MNERMVSLIRRMYGATLYHSGVVNRYRRRAAYRERLQILAYHQIEAPFFRRHLQYLVRNHNVVSLHELYRMLRRERSIQPGSVALTFDDGHISFYRQVFPLLRQYRVPATVFVATDFVGTTKIYWFDLVENALSQTNENRIQIQDQVFRLPARDRQATIDRILAFLKTLAPSQREVAVQALVGQCGYHPDRVPEGSLVINWTQASEMQATGLVEIGGHTCSHPILSQLDPGKAREEIQRSKEILARQLGGPIRFFAYPNGRLQDLTPNIINYVRDAGYLAAVTLVEGSCFPGDDPYVLKRISTSGGFTFPSLAAKMAGLWF